MLTLPSTEMDRIRDEMARVTAKITEVEAKIAEVEANVAEVKIKSAELERQLQGPLGKSENNKHVLKHFKICRAIGFKLLLPCCFNRHLIRLELLYLLLFRRIHQVWGVASLHLASAATHRSPTTDRRSPTTDPLSPSRYGPPPWTRDVYDQESSCALHSDRYLPFIMFNEQTRIGYLEYFNAFQRQLSSFVKSGTICFMRSEKMGPNAASQL